MRKITRIRSRSRVRKNAQLINRLINNWSVASPGLPPRLQPRLPRRQKDRSMSSCYAYQNFDRILNQMAEAEEEEPVITNSSLPFSCPSCVRCFQTATELKLHSRSHQRDGGFGCSQCNERFTTASLLKTHERLVHALVSEPEPEPEPAPNKGLYRSRPGWSYWSTCPDCKQRFHNSTLLRHRREKHQFQIGCLSVKKS